MIPRSSIKAFFAQPRDDLRVYKRLADERIEQLKDDLPIQPPIWKRLRKHQKIGLLVGAKYKRISYWFDCGTGKTFLSIALIQYFRKLQTIKKKALILVPNNINRYEWAREIEKHSTISYLVLDGSTQQKWKLLDNTDAVLIITTYLGLVHMVCDLKTIVKKKKTEDKLIPIKQKVDALASHFDCLINDESTSIGNRSTLFFRIGHQIAKVAPIAFNLTGTPFGRDPTPLWAQMYLIDRGESLGKTLGLFRAAFFKEEMNYFSGWPDYVFDKKKTSLLNDLLAHRSLRWEADKADLPQVVSIVKNIALPDEADAYYEKMREKLIAAHGNYREMKNVFLRMRQISSGFLGYFDDEKGVKASFEFTPNPKLEMLISLIEQIKDSYKIVVMHDFVFSGTMITRELKRLKIGYAAVFGKVKSGAEHLRKFDHDDKCRVFVTNTAGAFSLNLQIAKYQIFYESPPSPILRKQMESRVERQESKHEKVFRYELVAAPVDQKILDAHREGKNLFESVFKHEVSI